MVRGRRWCDGCGKGQGQWRDASGEMRQLPHTCAYSMPGSDGVFFGGDTGSGTGTGAGAGASPRGEVLEEARRGGIGGGAPGGGVAGDFPPEALGVKEILKARWPQSPAIRLSCSTTRGCKARGQSRPGGEGAYARFRAEGQRCGGAEVRRGRRLQGLQRLQRQ